MGPIQRYLGPLVPKETLIWQDPIPKVNHRLVGDKEVAALKAKNPERIATVAGDVRDYAAHAQAVALALKTFGKLDTLVGNAGVFDFHRPLKGYTPAMLTATFDEIFAINLRGYLYAAHAAHEALIVALDAGDIAAIEAATQALAAAVEAARAIDGVARTPELAERLSSLSVLAQAAQGRVNFLTDDVRRRVGVLSALAGREPDLTYRAAAR